MEQAPICYFAVKGGLEDRMAQIINNEYTKEDLATLRGLYEMEEGNGPLIPEGVDERTLSDQQVLDSIVKLVEYKNKQAERHLKQMSNSSQHLAKTFTQLYYVDGWNENTRRNRINMIASEVSAEVSRRVAQSKKMGIDLSREQVLNGYKSNGEYHHGQAEIFEAVFNRLINKFNEARSIISQAASFGITKDTLSNLPEKERKEFELAFRIVEEYPKVFKNWAALCTFARITLRNTESLKLGQTLRYAAPTSPDNFSMDSPLEDTYDLEESVREAWMTHQSETSAFGSLGSEVRRFLATITDVDSNGNKVKDDLGYLQQMDPIETHQYLAEILRGITSESAMVRKLSQLAETDVKIKAVFDALALASKADLSKSIDDNNKPKNPVIITQLLVDMHKNMVPYLALIKNKAGKIISKVLNNQENPLHGEFILRVASNTALSPISVYGSDGRMNWEAYANWYKESKELLPMPKKNEVNTDNVFASATTYNPGTGFYGLTRREQMNYLVRASQALGIDMTDNTAIRILNNPELRRNYLSSLRDFRVQTRLSMGDDVMKAFDTISKYGGLKPSLTNGNSVEEINAYNQALEKLNNRNEGKGISYKEFLSKVYGKGQEKSKGFGMESVNKMLDSVAKVSNYLKTERRVSWFDRKGKANSRFSDRTPSYMGDMIDRIHEFVSNGDAEGLKSFIMDKWGQSSFFYDKSNGRFLNSWLQQMYDSIKTDTRGNVTIDENAFAKVFQVEEFLGSNIDGRTVIFENFTEKQHAEAMLKNFLELRDRRGTKINSAKYPCFILGDSGAQMFFTATYYDVAHGGADTIINGLKDVFRQEIERRKYVKATNEVLLKHFASVNGFTVEESEGNTILKDKDGNVIPESNYKKLGYRPIDNFSQTENEFTMLTFLNHTFENGKYWKILTGNENMSDAEVKKLSKAEAMQQALSSLGTDALTDALTKYMNDATNKFLQKLVSVGILTESKSEGGAITYTDTSNYFKGNLDFYGKNVEAMVRDFFWNTKYATIEQLQMFTVDPAFYDHRYPVKDLQKRYKEIYAPGKGISLEARDYDGNLYMTRPYERVAYFDDISLSSEDINPAYWNVLKETFKDNPNVLKLYKKNTLTDGQGYRTLDSYRAVKGMAGEWTSTMEEAYKRIKSIRENMQRDGRTNATEEELKELSSLAVMFQPIKPYLYTLEKLRINDNGDTALIPVQHKYAEVVLIPELLKDGKLKDIAMWMENHTEIVDGKEVNAPIDMIASTKCVKVGAFGSVDIKGINDTDALNKTLNKAFVHNLAWADYRIQSGVPEHLNHAQLFGTQIRKLILAGINKGKDYDYLNKIFNVKTNNPRGATVYLPGMGKVYLSGNNLVSLYNCLVMANMFDNYDMFEKQTATNKALSDKLLQNVISNNNQSEDNAFGFSLIEDGEFKGDFVIPLGEPSMEHDAAALLFSLFKKNVNKQKIKGGSAVQASALGLSGYEDAGDLFEVVSPDGDNVLYDEIEMPFNCSYLSYKGQSISLKFEDWCNPDGTLKMSNKIVYGEEALEYLPWPVSGRDKYGKAIDASQGYYVPLIEQKYPGILDIIAYRIPTEMEYSMVNCKVFRFSNPIMGGTMKIPSSRTTTGGFDFDIDKLYFFMREFSQLHLSDNQIEDIWHAIYAENPAWKAALEAARENDRAGKKLLDKVISGFFEENEEMTAINNGNKNASEKKLHDYWEAAGLEGTDSEAFTKYLENHRDEYPVFDTYNPEASPLNPVMENGNVVTPGNSRAARNNLLLDLMRARLMDKETLKQRYTPGGFSGNSDAALRMRVLRYADKNLITTNGHIDWAKVDAYVAQIKDDESDIKDPEPEFDISDPTTILTYNQQNQVAGKLIGIFANQNTNHVYSSLLHKLELATPIFFGNHTMDGLKDMLHAPKGIDVDINVAEYLAASVDAVKDPVLNYLNLNSITADAGAVLARIGYTPMEIGLLFNQPIIIDVCNYAANNGVGTDVAIVETLKKYDKRASLKKIQYSSSEVSTDKLADNILKSIASPEASETAEFKRSQLQVLALFNEILADTKDVSSFVQSTRFTAANSIGSTFGDQVAQEDRVQQFVDKYGDKTSNSSYVEEGDDADNKPRLSFQLFDPETAHSERTVSPEEASLIESNQGILNNSEDLLDITNEEYMAQMSRNPLAFEQCMMDLTRKAAKKLFSKHFPYYTSLYKDMRKILGDFSKYGNLDADTINSLHREFMVYLLSRQEGSMFDGEALNTSIGDYTTNREYFTKWFPLLVSALKEEGALASIPLFNALTIKENEELEEATLSVQGMGGLQSGTSNALTEMWADAFTSETVVKSNKLGLEIPVSKLAKDLFFYNYYKLGFNFHPTVFMSLAPTMLKLGLTVDTATEQKGYIDFINEVISGTIPMGTSGLFSFAKQYMLNHLDNNRFVFTVKGNARNAVQEAMTNNGHQFTLFLSKLSPDVAKLFRIPDSSLKKGWVAFTPIIAIETKDAESNKVYTRYYMANNSNPAKFNVTDAANGSMTYVEVVPQGTKGKSIKYYGDEAFGAVQEGRSIQGYNAERIAKAQSEAPITGTEATQDGTAEAPAENSFIEIQQGDDVSNMFTEAEWDQMFKAFMQKYPGVIVEADADAKHYWRTLMSDTNESVNLQILNELANRIRNGEKMKTIGENGEEINVCS